jgi:hypothetical protein
MIQTMFAARGGSPTARGGQRKQALMVRQALGLAIVAGGFAVLVAQALQHALGG